MLIFKNSRISLISNIETITDLRNYLFQVSSMSHSELLDIEEMFKTKYRKDSFKQENVGLGNYAKEKESTR